MTASASRSAGTVAGPCTRRNPRRLRRWRRRHPKNALTKIETKEEGQDALGSGDARPVDTLLLATSTWERVPGQLLPDLRDRHHLCRPHQWGHRRWHQVRLWRQLQRTTMWIGSSIWWDIWWMFNERWDKPFLSTSGTIYDRCHSAVANDLRRQATQPVRSRNGSARDLLHHCRRRQHQSVAPSPPTPGEVADVSDLDGRTLQSGAYYGRTNFLTSASRRWTTARRWWQSWRTAHWATHNHRLHQVCSPMTWTRTSRFKSLHDDGATWTSRRWTHNGSLGHRLQ